MMASRRSKRAQDSGGRPARSPAGAVDAGPGPTVLDRLGLTGRLGVVLLNLLSAGLLSAAFAPHDLWVGGYVALTPLVLCLSSERHPRWALFGALLGGVVFWAANLYWLTWITLVGYIPLVLMFSGYWVLSAWVVREALRRRWPVWLALPVVWVALEYLRSYVLGGFPWFVLAHTQWTRTSLIQISDLTGQYGLSFLVAMVNGLVGELAVRASAGQLRRSSPSLVTGSAVTAALFAAVLGYGYWRLGQQTQAPGPVIGIVQQAYPIALDKESPASEVVLESHLAGTEKLQGRGVDMVIWPETMLPNGLNRQVLTTDAAALDQADMLAYAREFFGPGIEREFPVDQIRTGVGRRIGNLAQDAGRVAEMSRGVGAPIVAGGASYRRNESPLDDADRVVRGNSVLVFDGAPLTTQEYDKVHCVPFSEYVPFKRSWPWAHRLLRWFVPESMAQLEPGRTYHQVQAGREGRSWRLATPICFEGTFDRVCRKLVWGTQGRKADVLVNLSNDGWFVCQWGPGPYRGSAEHAIHLSHYVFRAVECRLPVVRAVNTGISASIDSNGRLLAVAQRDGRRTMVPATLVLDGRGGEEDSVQHGPRVLVDSRVSVYSLWGDWFALIVSGMAVALLAGLTLGRPKVQTSKGTP